MRYSFLCALILCVSVFAGNPKKDLIGTLEDFKKSEQFVIMYYDSAAAKKVCSQLNIVLVREDQDLRFLMAEMNDDISLSTLVKLTSAWGVKSVAASPKKNRFGKEESPTFLKAISEKDAKLTDAQVAIVEKLKKESGAENLLITRLLRQGLLEIPPLKVNISESEKIEFGEFDISATKNTYLITSKSDKGEVILNFSLKADSITGFFYHAGKRFEVKPIGKGLHIVVQLNPK